MLRAAGGIPLSVVGSASEIDAVGNFSVDVSAINIQTDDVALLLMSSDTGDATMTIAGFSHISGPTTSGEAVADYWLGTMSGGETAFTSSNGSDLTQTSVIVLIVRGVTTTGAGLASASGTSGDPAPPQGAVVSGDEAMSIILIANGTDGVPNTVAGTISGYTKEVERLYGAPNYSQGTGYSKIITTQDSPGTSNYVPDTDWVAYTVTLQEA